MRHKHIRHIQPDRVRRGFTLVEVLVASLIFMVIAAVALKSLSSYLDFKNAQSTATVLQNLATAIKNNSATGFYDKVLMYPGQISELTTPIVAGTTADKNSCGATFTATQVTNWNNNGPFYTSYAAAGTGLMTPIGIVQDSMSRNPCTGSPCNPVQNGWLEIRMTGIPLTDTQNLDQVMDGGDGGSAGSIRYVTPSVTAGAGYADIKFEAVAVANAKC